MSSLLLLMQASLLQKTVNDRERFDSNSDPNRRTDDFLGPFVTRKQSALYPY